ncbi:piggyBac transposable element-derived protein 1-like [Melanaphis sacchari]|uniref:piggyBac transposable element-derived protein 1-like n=1 Tax=Melanaphis sacchari TaxID=742174 RepID=UPI000DC15894|nr:piggyBac transposable element-derived protein 1-like [Melanaphis sacchari]
MERSDSNDGLFNENDFDFVIPPTPDTVPSQHNRCHQDASLPSWNDDDAFQSNILFNPNNELVGINHDIIDTLAEGIIMWMGLCPQPSIASYWKKSEIYTSKIPKYMARKRFEIILRSFHCCNNDHCPPGDHLFKISGLLDLLLSKYKMARTPKESMCIDESIVPYVGRLSFRQYIQNKRHRYRIKIFKLCIDNFYTVGFRIYAGKDAVVGQRLSTRIITEMAEDYLDIGRTMYTDNWYSSYDLATELLKRSTLLVGTLRANRKNNPTEVIKKQLKRGKVIAK